MDNENKVVMSLEKYNELYECVKEKDIKLMQIVSLILNYTEFDEDKNKLIVDTYHIKYGRLMDIVKEIAPKEYETRLKELKDEED